MNALAHPPVSSEAVPLPAMLSMDRTHIWVGSNAPFRLFESLAWVAWGRCVRVHTHTMYTEYTQYDQVLDDGAHAR